MSGVHIIDGAISVHLKFQRRSQITKLPVSFRMADQSFFLVTVWCLFVSNEVFMYIELDLLRCSEGVVVEFPGVPPQQPSPSLFYICSFSVGGSFWMQ